jgi:hypothetical protein
MVSESVATGIHQPKIRVTKALFVEAGRLVPGFWHVTQHHINCSSVPYVPLLQGKFRVWHLMLFGFRWLFPSLSLHAVQMSLTFDVNISSLHLIQLILSKSFIFDWRDLFARSPEVWISDVCSNLFLYVWGQKIALYRGHSSWRLRWYKVDADDATFRRRAIRGDLVN